MPAGRPPGITQEIVERVASLIASGLYAETAAWTIGVNRKTLERWLKRGAAELRRVEALPRLRVRVREALYVELCRTVEQAAALADARDVRKLDELAQGGIDVGHEVTTTTRTPLLDRNGKQRRARNGDLLWRTSVVTQRRVAKSLPNAAALMWRLERRNAKDFGRRGTSTGRSGDDRKPLIPLAAIRDVLANRDEEAQLDASHAFSHTRTSENTPEPAS